MQTNGLTTNWITCPNCGAIYISGTDHQCPTSYITVSWPPKEDVIIANQQRIEAKLDKLIALLEEKQ